MSIRSLASGLSRILELVVGLQLILIVLIALAEVLFRYFFYSSIVWSAELNRFLFIWLAFLGAAAAVHHRMHFRLTLLWRSLTANARARLEVAVDVTMGAFGFVLLIKGLEIVGRTAGQRSSALLLPMPIVYTVVPLSGALVILFVLLRLIQVVQAGGLTDPRNEYHSEQSPASDPAGQE
jgi:TRAP-type transport system small permease protein